MAKDVVELTDANFESSILTAQLPALVDFYATWCPPCKAAAPIVEEIAAEYKGKLVVGKVNTDESPKTAVKYKVSAIPTLIIFKNGLEVERMVGFRGKEALKAAIDARL